MVQASENNARLDEYRMVEDDFWERLNPSGDRDFRTSQLGTIFEHLLPKLRDASLAEGLTENDYHHRLRDAAKVIDDIASALCAFWKEPRRDLIWYKPALVNLNSKPDDWREASPVSTDSLDDATAKYLARPWMQSNGLDWYILNGYIFDETARMGDGIKSGRAVGITNWPYVLADGDYEKTIYYGLMLTAAKFLGRWVLAPAAITALYYFDYETAALWVAIPYAIYIALHLSLFAMRHSERRAV